VKVIIFSEWVRMLELVRDHLRQKRVGFAWHTGSVPQQKRRDEIRRFKDDPRCRVFLSTDSGGTGLNLQNASVVINCDLPWNPARLEQRIARAWRKHQRNPVTVINLVAENTIEHGMLGTLAAKRSLADGVLDLRGELERVPLHPAGRTFFQRLEQILSKDAPAKTTATGAAANANADPAAAFAQAAAALFSGRVTGCEERHPDADARAPDAPPPPPVVLVTVDRDAAALRPGLDELRAKFLPDNTRLEVIDRATAQALERLREAGLVQTTARGVRALYPIFHDTAGAAAPLTDAEKTRAAAHRAQAAKRLRLAGLLLDEGFDGEARDALRAAALELVRATAVEQRVAAVPGTLSAALAPPLAPRS
jgi:hypothetical protein